MSCWGRRSPPHCSRKIHNSCYELETEKGSGTDGEACLAVEQPDGTRARSVSRPKYAEVVDTKQRGERRLEILLAFEKAFDERSARRIYPR